MFDLLRRLPPVPAVCEVCARWPSETVCADCRERHGRWLPRCRSCALPLAPGLDLCSRCTQSPPGPLRELAARVDYRHPWVSLVARFKTDPTWAAPMARLIWQAPEAVRLLDETDCLLPIPLSPAKLAQRGFNQAWELARALRRLAGKPPAASPCLLRRDAAWQDQHRLSRADRLDNVRGAFSVTGQPHELEDRRVLLVDDVATTGATLRAAADVLLQAGAREVSALVFARTPAPQDS